MKEYPECKKQTDGTCLNSARCRQIAMENFLWASGASTSEKIEAMKVVNEEAETKQKCAEVCNQAGTSAFKFDPEAEFLELIKKPHNSGKAKENYDRVVEELTRKDEQRKPLF